MKVSLTSDPGVELGRVWATCGSEKSIANRRPLPSSQDIDSPMTEHKVENLSFLPLTAERHHNAQNLGNKPTSRTLSFDRDITLKILKASRYSVL